MRKPKPHQILWKKIVACWRLYSLFYVSGTRNWIWPWWNQNHRCTAFFFNLISYCVILWQKIFACRRLNCSLEQSSLAASKHPHIPTTAGSGFSIGPNDGITLLLFKGGKLHKCTREFVQCTAGTTGIAALSTSGSRQHFLEAELQPNHDIIQLLLLLLNHFTAVHVRFPQRITTNDVISV